MRPDKSRATGDENAHRSTVETKGKRSKSTARFVIVCILVFTLAASATVAFRVLPIIRRPTRLDPAFQLPSPLALAALPLASRFDFPIGAENGAFAYNAQPFTENRHLGDDLNGIGGENSDRGDPIYAVADGKVIFAREGGPGWGNVIIVLHAYDEGGARRYVQSYYAHCETILVKPRQEVRRGQKIATIGTAGGRYLAHLHFEMRAFTTPFVGPGYRENTEGWLNPSVFISEHRGASEDDVGRSQLPAP